MGINLGAFLSPLVCGTLAAKYGFEWGFASAGVGMLTGLVIYKLFENKLLGDNGLKPIAQNTKIKNAETNNNNSKLLYLFVLMLFTIPFWICFEQAGTSLTLFAEYQTNRSFLGYEIPTGYFQSLNPLFIIILAPAISVFWSWLRSKSKEPTSVEKFAIALFLMSISYIILILAGNMGGGETISPLWLVLVYFVMTVSELCLSPIGLSLVSKLAPEKFLSLMMSCWFLTCFIGDTLAGFWGGKYETLTSTQLFAPLAAMSFAAFLLLVVLIPKLNKSLKL
jgi:POT family proton-dependent oligopeptide transporter